MRGSLLRRAWVGCFLVSCAFAASAPSALAAPGNVPGAKRGAAPPDYGLDFVTIGAPGNRHMLPGERHYNQWFSSWNGIPAQVGRVDHKFRIMKSVVRVEEWFQFVNVAWPIWDEWGQARTNSAFSSLHINANNFNPANGPPGWEISHGSDGQPVTMTWRVAALYCNWLHNGRPTGPNVDMDMLRTGAYDISTFTRNPDGTWNDQYSRSPGAKYWVPDLHEWTKAVYYDPDRYGEGEDGYWLFPYSTQDPPPGFVPPDPAYGFETPWGLIDVMGGNSEWTETLVRPTTNEYGEVSNGDRLLRGSNNHWEQDYNDNFWMSGTAAFLGGHGLRIASLVPSPGAAALFAFTSLAGFRRERRPAMN